MSSAVNDKKNDPGWKHYVYQLIASEISAATRFFDECIQISPLRHDTKLLLKFIECPVKSSVSGPEKIEEHRDESQRRRAYFYNGNFNYVNDIQQQLGDLYKKLSRDSRLFIVVYNPFMGGLYKLASWMGLRDAPQPDVYLTESSLRTFAKLAGYEVVRIRPAVFLPWKLPLISNWINRILPVIPFVRQFSFLWLLVLRPIIPDEKSPSLSIIIPARNEAGNIANALKRIPEIPGAELDVIFVEGNSNDDTWQRIQEELQKHHSGIRISAYKQPGKGKNDAVRVGFEHAQGDLVTILDADLTMPPEMLVRYYDAYRNGLGNFINGSRLIYPMENQAMRPLNRLGNLFFSRLLSSVLDLPITDSLCGTKMFSLHDYRRIVNWRQRFGDFDPFGDFEMLFASAELTLGVIDIPIPYCARTYGETNISRFRHGLQLIRMSLIGFCRIRLGKIR